MAKPPFRVSPTPPGEPAPVSIVKAGPAAVFAHANDPDTADDLPEAGRDLGGPDHPALIPWPAAEPEKDNAGHKPFKLK